MEYVTDPEYVVPKSTPIIRRSGFAASPLLDAASVLATGVLLPLVLGKIGLIRPFGLRTVGDGNE
jgi:hypothetical protein